MWGRSQKNHHEWINFPPNTQDEKECGMDKRQTKLQAKGCTEALWNLSQYLDAATPVANWPFAFCTMVDPWRLWEAWGDYHHSLGKWPATVLNSSREVWKQGSLQSFKRGTRAWTRGQVHCWVSGGSSSWLMHHISAESECHEFSVVSSPSPTQTATSNLLSETWWTGL